jgi:glycosyltransferase involved in cell wall biosynthesis
MRPPQVLYVIDVLSSTHGGAEGILWTITRHMPAELYRCSVATFSPDADLVPVERFNCPVYRFPIQRTYDWQALKAACRLARLIRSQRFDIVHTFFPASDLLGGLAAKLSGCPILISSRRDMGLLRGRAHQLAYRLAGPHFDQVHAVADEVRDFHIRCDHLDPRRVFTVHNGVDIAAIDEAQPIEWSQRSRSGECCPVIACVANIRPIKAIEVLIRTAAIVRSEIPQARFLVIGGVQDNSYFDGLTALARQLGVSDTVTFLGPSESVPPLLKGCQIFYLPSLSEGLSNAMLEAMACGLPCVASDVGGNGELVIHDKTGYLVAQGDPAAAAQRILSLLQDPSLAARMGRAGRERVELSFSLQAMIGRLIELYGGLLHSSRTTHMGVDRVGAPFPDWRQNDGRTSGLACRPQEEAARNGCTKSNALRVDRAE